MCRTLSFNKQSTFGYISLRFKKFDEALARDALAVRVTAAAKANPQLEVQLRADQKVPYGQVAEMLAMIQKAGLNRIGFITEAPK